MKEFLNSAFGSWIKVFVAAILGLVLTNLLTGIDLFEMNWKSLVSGAVASVLPIIINWLNPSDTRYGKGKE